MMMKRPAAAMYAVLPLLVALAVCVSFLFQISDCSRPSPSPAEPRTIPRPVPVVVLRGSDDDDESHVQRHHRDDNADGIGSTTRPTGLEMEAAGAVGKKQAPRADDYGGGAASSPTTAPARDVVDHQVGSGSSNLLGGALMMKATPMRPPVRRLRSELPRRVLAGAADSGARSSCHSSDVHIGCPPSRN